MAPEFEKSIGAEQLEESMKYDVIVNGAGSAGCVLATRLSENPERSVLLLEAAPTIQTLSSTLMT